MFNTYQYIVKKKYFIRCATKFAYAQFLFITFSFIFYISLLTGCANIIPPSGGPRDSLPPVLIQAFPSLNTTNFTGNKITLTFDEFVEVKSPQENLLVSPLPKGFPVVDYKLKTVTIKLKDSLKPNTTYSLNFGNGLVDVNEGNPLRNFTYTFSTGKYIDSNKISGNVMLAETGKIDTTLIAVLYSNLNDTAVLKTKPKYIARINGKGNFNFNNLPNNAFNLFVIPNDYSKKYDDSTKMFAFMESSIQASTTPTTVRMLAYEEEKKKEKKADSQKPNKKKLTYSTSLDGIKQDLLSKSIKLQFSNKLKSVDINKVRLTDSSFKPIPSFEVVTDTSFSQILINNKWNAGEKLMLILEKTIATDTFGNNLDKTDTIKFEVNKAELYGSLKLRLSNIEMEKNPVILFYSNDVMKESRPLTNNELYFNLFYPGEYEIRILYDSNKNGVWDSGNYKKHKQPERVISLKNKISVKANWDNEADIVL